MKHLLTRIGLAALVACLPFFSSAQCDSGTAVDITFNTGIFAGESSWDLVDAAGNIVLAGNGYTESETVTTYSICLDDGCYQLFMYDSFGDGWNGASWTASSGDEVLASTTLLEGEFGFYALGVNDEACSDSNPAVGCMDEAACNYDADATVSDYSCTYPGCLDEEAYNYNANAGCDADCIYAPDCDGLTVGITGFDGTFSEGTGSYVFMTGDGEVIGEGSINGADSPDFYCITDGCYGISVTAEIPGDEVWVSVAIGDWYISAGTYQDITTFSIVDGEVVWGDPCGFGFGCTDPEACNYDEEAEYADWSCTYPGCMDPLAMNYAPFAGCDDEGSCVYCNGEGSVAAQLYVCTFSQGEEVEMEILDEDGNTVIYVDDLGNLAIGYYDICLAEGVCYTVNMYNNVGDSWYGGYYWVQVNGYEFSTGTLETGETFGTATFSLDGSCPDEAVMGCTDGAALNYNADATEDDGSCEYAESCEDNLIFVMMYDSFGDGWNGSVYSIIDENGNEVASGTLEDGDSGMAYHCLADGCYAITIVDPIFASEISYEVTLDGNVIASGGAPGISEISLNSDEDCDMGIGCTNADACNYDETATVDDGSCTYPGCTDPLAFNYNFLAGCDDGSCVSCEEGVPAQMYVCTFSNGEEVSVEVLDEDGNVVISIDGLGDVAIAYFDICLQEGVCYTVNMYNTIGEGWYGGYYWIQVDGYTFSTGALEDGATEGSLTFSLDDSCPEEAVLGCTDGAALNYNPNATEDDGSCEYPEPCDANTVVFHMYDSFGDGWNGAVYEITASNGDVVATGSLEVGDATPLEGNYGTDELCLADDCYSVSIVGGAFLDEISYEVTLDGNLIGGGNADGSSFGVNTEDCGPVYGCTDPIALNFNADADEDDGSCEYGPGSDYTDPLYMWGVESGVAPNPFFGLVQVEVRGAIQNNTTHVTLHDLAGRLVLSTSFVAQSEQHTLELDGNNLESGNYILTVTSGSHSSTTMIVKQ